MTIDVERRLYVPVAHQCLNAFQVDIAGSSILQDTALSFSPELNSIIGGRGSGKSSLLEYVSFGLGRSCLDIRKSDYSGADRMEELIKDTLVAKGGSVVLKVVQDGAGFRIVRGPATAHQPQVTYPNGDVQTISVKELRSLFPAVVYSQGELAEIGKQTGKKAELSDLLQFVNPDYKVEDDRLSGVISSAKSAVRVAIEGMAEFWKLESQVRELVTKRDSLKQRVEALEKTLPQQSPEDQEKVSYYDKAADFESKRLQASKHATQLVDEVAACSKVLAGERDLTSQITADTESLRSSHPRHREDVGRVRMAREPLPDGPGRWP